MWANYHCHTRYCDGKNSPAELVAEAEAQGLMSLGISSHAPLPFASPWCMKREDLDSYLKEIHDLKRRTPALELYAGLEVDYIPGQISPAAFKHQLDYTIGSVHFGGFLADGRGWEIDGPHAQFLEGLEEIFHHDFKAAAKRYFELTREMIADSAPDIVGHLDKIKIQNIQGKFFNEQDSWYQQEIEGVLEQIKKYNSILEVNTRGVYQKKSDSAYPSPWIVRKAFATGIPVTLSSDAHHKDDLVRGFPDMIKQILQAGYREIHILSQGKWKPVPIDEHGITR